MLASYCNTVAIKCSPALHHDLWTSILKQDLPTKHPDWKIPRTASEMTWAVSRKPISIPHRPRVSCMKLQGRSKRGKLSWWWFIALLGLTGVILLAYICSCVLIKSSEKPLFVHQPRLPDSKIPTEMQENMWARLRESSMHQGANHAT